MYLSLHVCPSFCFSNFPFVLFSCVFKHFSFLFSFRNVFLLVLLLKCSIVFLTFFHSLLLHTLPFFTKIQCFVLFLNCFPLYCLFFWFKTVFFLFVGPSFSKEMFLGVFSFLLVSTSSKKKKLAE